MDKELMQWQELWKEGNAEEIVLDDLVRKMNKLERVTRIQKIFVPTMFLFSSFMMFWRLSSSWYNIIAISMIIVGFLVLVIPLYLSQISVIEGVGALNNRELVQAQIRKLKFRLRISNQFFLIFILLFTGALNIAFWGVESEVPKWILHMMTFVLFLILLLARKIKQKSFYRHITPMINQLERLYQEGDFDQD